MQSAPQHSGPGAWLQRPPLKKREAVCGGGGGGGYGRYAYWYECEWLFSRVSAPVRSRVRVLMLWVLVFLETQNCTTEYRQQRVHMRCFSSTGSGVLGVMAGHVRWLAVKHERRGRASTRVRTVTTAGVLLYVETTSVTTCSYFCEEPKKRNPAASLKYFREKK